MESKRSIRTMTGSYQVIKHSIGLGAQFPLQKVYETTGDHLYVSEINGANSVWLKIGERANPWIRVVQGDTITRPFNRVTIRSKIEGEEVSGFQTVILYSSTGPLINRQPLSYGLTRGFVTLSAALTTTPQRLGLFLAANPFPARDGLMSLGKLGGSLHIANRDTIETAFFGLGTYSSIPSLGQMYPISPRAEKVLNLDDSIRGGNIENDTVSPSELYLASSLLAGIDCRLMISNPDFDTTRRDTDNTSGGAAPFQLED